MTSGHGGTAPERHRPHGAQTRRRGRGEEKRATADGRLMQRQRYNPAAGHRIDNTEVPTTRPSEVGPMSSDDATSSTSPRETHRHEGRRGQTEEAKQGHTRAQESMLAETAPPEVHLALIGDRGAQTAAQLHSQRRPWTQDNDGGRGRGRGRRGRGPATRGGVVTEPITYPNETHISKNNTPIISSKITINTKREIETRGGTRKGPGI